LPREAEVQEENLLWKHEVCRVSWVLPVNLILWLDGGSEMRRFWGLHGGTAVVGEGGDNRRRRRVVEAEGGDRYYWWTLAAAVVLDTAAAAAVEEK
jgi:hypothetical protein